jgi:hypothetical protein
VEVVVDVEEDVVEVELVVLVVELVAPAEIVTVTD